MGSHMKINLKIALLDLYDGAENQGLRCLRELLNQFGEQAVEEVEWKEFEVRRQVQLPDLSYDIYISTGGPGSPLDSEGSTWEIAYFNWLEKLADWNNLEAHIGKKHVFFICHSFQLACRFFRVARVCKRKSTSFGVFPVHLLQDGRHEPVFGGMPDPFYAVDSRDYQTIEPNHNKLREIGGSILAIEKERPHVAHLERAIMALRFNDYMIGTQFHPEADAIGMSLHLQTPERKKIVIENHGEEKWKNMIDHLNDPDKIMFTHNHILPNFLKNAARELSGTAIV